MLERNEGIIFQDNDVVVASKSTGLVPGQVTIFPKKHFTILELINDDLLEKCSAMANKAGIAVFEALGVQGTNVLIQNGLGAGQTVPHFSIEIIPREQKDGLPLQWQPQPAGDDEIGSTLSLLKEEQALLVKETKQETKAVKGTKEEEEKEDSDDGKDSYLIKSVRRIP
ncbi:MAG: HIT family protein [Candidatus Woesearchaeota archaeon]